MAAATKMETAVTAAAQNRVLLSSCRPAGRSRQEPGLLLSLLASVLSGRHRFPIDAERPGFAGSEGHYRRISVKCEGWLGAHGSRQGVPGRGTVRIGSRGARQ